MRIRAVTTLTSSLVLGMIIAPGGQPQTNPDERPAGISNFGTSDEAITTLNGFAFRPAVSSTSYGGDAITGRWVTGGPDSLWSPLPEIPNGALLTQVAFYIHDTDPAADFTGRLCRHWNDSSDGLNPGSDCPVTVNSTGTGTSVISSAPNLSINYRFNLDGDAAAEAVSYTLAGNWGTSTDGGIRLRQVRLLWKRQVTPAPGTATFADVPVGHPLHRYVEALAASGITGGCGGGLYCPDAPISRGQMAVFLSAALGLHWPAF